MPVAIAFHEVSPFSNLKVGNLDDAFDSLDYIFLATASRILIKSSCFFIHTQIKLQESPKVPLSTLVLGS